MHIENKKNTKTKNKTQKQKIKAKYVAILIDPRKRIASP